MSFSFKFSSVFFFKSPGQKPPRQPAPVLPPVARPDPEELIKPAKPPDDAAEPDPALLDPPAELLLALEPDDEALLAPELPLEPPPAEIALALILEFTLDVAAPTPELELP